MDFGFYAEATERREATEKRGMWPARERGGKSGSSAAALHARRWGGGSRRSSGRWRSARVGARCRLACRWHQNEIGRTSAKRGRVRLSSEKAILAIVLRCECLRRA